MPAMIDSSGKPGIGGSARGVETELIAEVVVVAVTWIVSIGVLVITVCSELVLTVVGVEVDVATGIDDVEVTLLTLLVLVALEVVVTTDVLVTTLVDVEAVVVAPPPPPPPPPPVAPGGSRCKINASEVPGDVVTVVPTARPLVLDLRKRDWNEPPFGIAGVKDIWVQLVPS
jgi:hypothetical protein